MLNVFSEPLILSIKAALILQYRNLGQKYPRQEAEASPFIWIPIFTWSLTTPHTPEREEEFGEAKFWLEFLKLRVNKKSIEKFLIDWKLFIQKQCGGEEMLCTSQLYIRSHKWKKKCTASQVLPVSSKAYFYKWRSQIRA